MHAVAAALDSSSPAFIVAFGLFMLCCTGLLRRCVPQDHAEEDRSAGLTVAVRDPKLVSIDRGRATKVPADGLMRRAANG